MRIYFVYFRQVELYFSISCRTVALWKKILGANLRATVPPIEKKKLYIHVYCAQEMFPDLFLHVFKLSSQNITNHVFLTYSFTVFTTKDSL